MARTFQVGKAYRPYQTELDSMTVIRRTDKTIWCDTDGVKWSMRIKKDEDGNEYAVDSSVPSHWRDAFTYEA